MKSAPRSWLVKAKSVHDIGGDFYNPLGGKPWDDKQADQAERRWQNAGVRPLPVAEADAPYFGSRMHDSGVLGIERSKGALRIRLNSIKASDFASYLAATLDRPRVESEYPVDLLLQDAAYVRAAYADLRGGLRFVDPEGFDVQEFLYDWFFAQDGRLQWIAQLWRGDLHKSHDQRGVYLMVDCARASVEDRCPQVFAQDYGEPAARLYLDAVYGRDDRPIDFDVFDSGRQTMAYIRRRIDVHGFKPEDFRPIPTEPSREAKPT